MIYWRQLHTHSVDHQLANLEGSKSHLNEAESIGTQKNKTLTAYSTMEDVCRRNPLPASSHPDIITDFFSSNMQITKPCPNLVADPLGHLGRS
jgi:hypothetical protein